MTSKIKPTDPPDRKQPATQKDATADDKARLLKTGERHHFENRHWVNEACGDDMWDL